MICAGEASGDLHGASVADDLKTLDPQIELLGMGGSHMRTAGVDIVYDIADIGVRICPNFSACAIICPR